MTWSPDGPFFDQEAHDRESRLYWIRDTAAKIYRRRMKLLDRVSMADVPIRTNLIHDSVDDAALIFDLASEK